ncbi:hydroxyneurosporene dehydrogenase [Streptomyces sp. NPDC096033]|uniref:hydroxyneurosporene dehydrogenase n=1 Tax=Streptomyces sp. NPDC096033 TaxID=3366071 RepID=UPI00381DA8B2
MSHSASAPARLGHTEQDYRRLGLEPTTIKPWEDGLRTDGGPGSYEWWYFDAHLDDGAKLVIVFHTKDFTDLDKPLSPLLRIELTLPDGTQVDRLASCDASTFSASTEGCDVRMGDNVFAGDLHTYRIHAQADDVEVDVVLTGDLPAWRPATGHWLFGPSGEQTFAWLPAVPQGKVEATYSVNGRPTTVAGVGYHDHNWGNAPMFKLMHHWYWARGAAGPYSVIASHITAEKPYGHAELPVFMLARDGVLIGDDPAKGTFEELGRYTDQKTGKPVGNTIRYTYTDGEDRYVVTFTRHTDLASALLIDAIKGPKKMLAKVGGFDGAYLRFAGELRIEHHRDGAVVDSHAEDALWELMYFGKAL